MRSPRPLRLVLLLLLVPANLHCRLAGDGRGDGDKVCTAMACLDRAMITAKLSPEQARLGTHGFALTIDGASETCTVEFSNERETAYGQCSGGVEVFLGPAMQGQESAGEGVVSYTEVPIPGEFRWQLTLPGQPAKVRVIHTQGEQTIVDREATLVYEEHRPNGPGCEPVCRAASVSWDQL